MIYYLVNLPEPRSLPMKRLSVLFIMALMALTGCQGHLSQQKAYSALPMNPEDFQALDHEFTAVFFPISPMIAVSEEGLAWEIVILYQNGEQETYLASKMMYYESHNAQINLLQGTPYDEKLLALIPKSKTELEGSRAIVLSHDHSWCANLSGQDLGFCPSTDPDDFDWQKKASLVTDFSEEVKAESLSHQQLRVIFERALANEMIREENFGQTKAMLESIENGYSPWPDVIRITLTTGVTMLVVSLVASPITGAIVAGVTGGLDTAKTLIGVFGIPDLNHPEYMTGYCRNMTLGKFKLEFYQRYLLIQQRLNHLERNQQSILERLERLEQQSQ